MEFSEKLMGLRRRQGLSQEQLADRLGVTRQSVSKWEGGAAMPELAKLVALSELFGVSVDYLVKDYLEAPETAEGEDPARAERLEQKVDDLTRYIRGTIYAYDSKLRIFGLPLVSIRFGFARHQRFTWDHVARGVIAVGNAAVGVVAVGLVSVGVISLGILAAGLLAFGAVALGAAAIGVSGGTYPLRTAVSPNLRKGRTKRSSLFSFLLNMADDIPKGNLTAAERSCGSALTASPKPLSGCSRRRRPRPRPAASPA